MVVCKAREVEDSSALPGSGNTGSTAMRTNGSKVEMLQSFFQCKDGKLKEARHKSWLGQDPGGELSIAATKPASRRHICKLLLLQRRLRNLVVYSILYHCISISKFKNLTKSVFNFPAKRKALMTEFCTSPWHPLP